MKAQTTLFILLFCLGFVSSCTVKPFIVTQGANSERPERVLTSLGGSILTKSKTELASITLPDGTTLSHYVTGKNETSVPNAYIAGQVTEALGEMAAGVSNTGTAAEVSKAQITATQAVDIQKSKDAVEAARIAA